MKEIKHTLRHQQIAAIVVAKKIGSQLAKKHPEISTDYQNGVYQSEIARTYIPKEYERSVDVAISAVNFALGTLLSEQERKDLAQRHWQQSGKTMGEFTLENALGVHGRTSQECKEHGRIGGWKSLELGTGCFGLSTEEKKKANQRALEALGHISYDSIKETEYGPLDEISYILKLRDEFPCSEMSWGSLKEKVNAIYGNNRNKKTICTQYHHFKRKRSETSRNARARFTTDTNTRLGIMTAKEFVILLRESGEFSYTGAWKDISKEVEEEFGFTVSANYLCKRYGNWKRKNTES